MQSELFDKKVRDAADHHHPAYDEQAWRRMLQMLDKHLPQQSDNRRRFLFILLFLFLGGGGWLLIGQPWKPTNPGSRQLTEQTTTPSGEKQVPAEQTNIPKEEAVIVNSNNPVPGENSTVPAINPPATEKNRVRIRERRIDPLTAAISDQLAKSNRRTTGSNETVNKEPVEKIVEPFKIETLPPVGSTDKSNDAADVRPSNPVTTPSSGRNELTSQEIKKDVPVTNTDIPVTAVTKEKKNKVNSRKPAPFFLSLSAGPDISFAGQSAWGDTRLVAGVGAGYSFGDRLTVRTGFYTGRKIYSAAGDEYNPPAEFWTFYPYLEHVDANCKVYEIPLSLSYHFGRSAKKDWFVSGGVSTYLMKEEQYSYFYKYTPTGPTYNRKMTFKNDNNHFLSVLSLSAGYKRNLSSRVFVMAEPYLKLPLSGVGYGKVKLNSGGVLMTIGVRPFNMRSQTPAQR